MACPEGLEPTACAAVTLLRECERTLEMWADVAPAVSLRADIRKLLTQVA